MLATAGQPMNSLPKRGDAACGRWRPPNGSDEAGSTPRWPTAPKRDTESIVLQRIWVH